METVYIKDEFIKLGQVLKLAGIAESGVDAKEMVINGQAMVNGEVDLRRGRKVYPGDEITCNGETFKVESR